MDRKREIKARRLEMSLDAGLEWEANAPQREEALHHLLVRGPAGTDSPQRVQQFLARESARTAMKAFAPDDPEFLGVERRFGPTLDYEYVAPSAKAQSVGFSVARLVEPQPPGVAPYGFATGFLVTPRLLLTNWHVFRSASEAEGVAAQFGYEYRGVLLQDGLQFQLEPERFFYCSKELDLALVALSDRSAAGDALSRFSFIRLIPTVGKILKGHSVHLIGHPEGQPKTYVSKNNPLIDILPQTLLYLTDSDEGASGSPAFNPQWELVALHHRAVPRMVGGQVMTKHGTPWKKGDPTEDVDWAANQGIRVSVIVEHLRTLKGNSFIDELLDLAHDPVPTNPPRAPVILGEEKVEQKIPAVGAVPGVNMTFTGPVSIHIQTQAPVPAVETPDAGRQGPTGDALGTEVGIRFDPRYGSRKGYDESFLTGHGVSAPETVAERARELLMDAAGKPLVLHYRHFSLVMHYERRLQMWSAVNVSYAPEHRKWFTDRDSFGDDKWIADPRIAAERQLMDPEIYKPSLSLQRGHMVRREDNAWGYTKADQEYANSDTFHWTNCTPQHGGFNQSSYSVPGKKKRTYAGIWGGLENKIQQLAKSFDESRMSIFSGPMLNPKDDAYDWGFGPIQIPMRYWKVVVGVEGGQLTAYGFVLDQTKAFDDLGFERLDFGEFETYGVPVADICSESGVRLDESVLAADVLKGGQPYNLPEGSEIRRNPR